MSENKDNRTATQKIEDLEKVVTVLYQTATQNRQAIESLFATQRDMTLVKDALKLLNKKTEAIVQTATPESGITPDSVAALVVKMNVDELTAQVSAYVTNGHLAAADEVATNSFLVCEEYNPDGTLVNPRTQFRMDSLDATVSGALLGKKVGETASFGENTFSAKVLEIYTILEPKAPGAAPTDAPTDAPETASTAPADSTETQAASTTPAPSAAPAGPSNEALALPAETPVTQFVASDPSTLATA